MKKRILSLLLALLLLTCLLAGCSSSPSGGGDDTSASADTAASTQQNPPADTPREDVVIAISSEPDTLDPCQGWGHGTTPLVPITLVEYKQDMSFTNDLATNYFLSEDGLTWTFTLREDVSFTDGEPLTAEDVAFTFNTAKESQSSLDLTFMDKA